MYGTLFRLLSFVRGPVWSFWAPGIPYPVVIVEDDVRGGERGVAAEVHLDLAGEPPAR